MTKRIGVISDIHTGSIFGLMPPGYINKAGIEVKLNKGQEYLWECWQDSAKTFGKLDALVINGDGPDGEQRAQHKMEACLNSVSEQCEALKLAMEPVIKQAKPEKIFVVQGTEYHDSTSGEAMDGFGADIGAVRYEGSGTGRCSREVLDLNIDGVIINFSHGISVATGFYMATPLDREGLWSALAGKESKLPKADCVVRSHGHRFVHLEFESKHIVMTPAWQLQTRFMRRNSVYRMIPDMGRIIIEVDAEAKRTGEDAIRICKRLYALPKIGTTRL